MKVDHNYLREQFAHIDGILAEISNVVGRGDFTLGKEVGLFEEDFARMVGVKHAIGVGNGTDALFLALKAMGVNQRSHEVITSPYSFYATTAAIWNAGGTPVFVDTGNDFNIAPNLIEEKITPHTVGILPVHWAGKPCNMSAILNVAKDHGLWTIEDCAHAPNSMFHGKKCGAWGHIGCFSLHPLKNVNVWGDGGVITTDDDDAADWIRKARNHGMVDRNSVEFWGWNSRLDTIQAVVGRYVLSNIEKTTAARRKNAKILTSLLSGIPEIKTPDEPNWVQQNYYLYSMLVSHRDALVSFLNFRGVDAKVHYPTPLHLQPAAKALGYKRGDFPGAERCAQQTVSLPVHDWITPSHIQEMVALIHQFYEGVRNSQNYEPFEHAKPDATGL